MPALESSSAKEFAGFFRIAAATGHGTQRHTAHAEEGSEGHDQRDDGECQTHTGESHTVAVTHVT